MRLKSFEDSTGKAEPPVRERPQKVALVSDWFLPRLGGLELHLRDLAHHLMESGCRVEVITPFPGPNCVEGIPVHRLRVSRVPRLGFTWSPSLAEKLRSRLVAGEFDLVHSHFSIISPAAFWGVREAIRLGLPAVLTFHSILRHFKWVLLGADFFFNWSRWPILLSAVSNRVARDVTAVAGKGRVSILPNAIDMKFWDHPRRENPGPTVKLVSVQRLHKKKRPEALIRLMSRLRSRLPGSTVLSLDLVGDGPERSELESLVRRLNLEDCVHFHGVLDRPSIRKLFTRSDAFVSLTRLEAFGLACMEARCAGLPVFGIGGNGLDDWMGEGAVGGLAQTDAEIAEGLIRWICQGKPITDTPVPKIYDWEQGVCRHLVLYREARERLPLIPEPKE